MNYRISQKANLDLENIWIYTFENWSKEKVDRYINFIIDQIEYVAKNPSSGQNCDFIRKGYFRSRIKSHLIFYKDNPKLYRIEIVRILHYRMDIETRLSE